MKRVFRNYKLILVLIFELLVFILITETSFAYKLQFGGFNVKNNPVNRQLGQKMEISGKVFYFTDREDPSPVWIKVKIGGELDLPVEVNLTDEIIINEEANKKMQEWTFSADWDGYASFSSNSFGAYECLIEAGVEDFENLFQEKIIRLGVVELENTSE